MGASNDARFVLYRLKPPSSTDGIAYVADTHTGKSIRIALPDGELVSDGTLSGLGQYAFLSTTAGRIVRVPLESGRIETVVPGTHVCTSFPPWFARGSLTHLTCPFAHKGDDLSGRILLNNAPVPVLYTKDGKVGIQVPWEGEEGDHVLAVDVPNESPFDTSVSVAVRRTHAMFERAEPRGESLHSIQIVNEDFSGFVTAPPAPGDIVHIYMTGLGPVTPPVETGVPTPPAPTSTITQPPPRCRFLPQETEAETVFAGLVAGTIGLYRASFRIPNVPGSTGRGISCTFGSQAWGVSSGSWSATTTVPVTTP